METKVESPIDCWEDVKGRVNWAIMFSGGRARVMPRVRSPDVVDVPQECTSPQTFVVYEYTYEEARVWDVQVWRVREITTDTTVEFGQGLLRRG